MRVNVKTLMNMRKRGTISKSELKLFLLEWLIDLTEDKDLDALCEFILVLEQTKQAGDG